MTKKEILAHLVEWERVQRELDAKLDAFCDLTGAQPDSELLTAIYAVAGAHTNAVELIIGDEMQWCDWWKYECQYGARNMGPVIIGNKQTRQVKTLKQLAALIAT